MYENFYLLVLFHQSHEDSWHLFFIFINKPTEILLLYQ